MWTRRVTPLALLTAAVALSACGTDAPAPDAGAAPAAQAEPRAELEHVHGLGVDPGSGTLHVATHYGLFQAAEGDSRLRRTSESRQDVMGFSVVGPGRFIGSGHPDPAVSAPPNIGLVESRDAGATFESVSLLGEADFHVLRAAGRQVYGFDGASGRLMVSTDGGRRWVARTPPGAVFDLAVDPADRERLVASTENGIFGSDDAARRWRPLAKGAAGLLAWTAPDRLVLVDGSGTVSRSADGGRRFAPVGTIGGPPSAFAAAGDDLLAALEDGTVVRSRDGGARWTVRATP